MLVDYVSKRFCNDPNIFHVLHIPQQKGRKLNLVSCDPAVLHFGAFGKKFQLIRPSPQQHDVLVLTSLIRDDENTEGMIRAAMSYRSHLRRSCYH